MTHRQSASSSHSEAQESFTIFTKSLTELSAKWNEQQESQNFRTRLYGGYLAAALDFDGWKQELEEIFNVETWGSQGTDRREMWLKFLRKGRKLEVPNFLLVDFVSLNRFLLLQTSQADRVQRVQPSYENLTRKLYSRLTPMPRRNDTSWSRRTFVRFSVDFCAARKSTLTTRASGQLLNVVLVGRGKENNLQEHDDPEQGWSVATENVKKVTSLFEFELGSSSSLPATLTNFVAHLREKGALNGPHRWKLYKLAAGLWGLRVLLASFCEVEAGFSMPVEAITRVIVSFP
jgi:hypothetical protein